MTIPTIQELALPGVLLITPESFVDERGYFTETYSRQAFHAAGLTEEFVQDNLSYSKKGVLRGLHYQRPPYAQSKLVRVTQGEIFDVVADCEPNSPSYGQYVSAHLSAKRGEMLFVPARYAHGFCVIGDDAIVEYKVDAPYHKLSAGGALWNDPVLNIDWPLHNPLLSPQDKAWALLPKAG